jgi:hypothetical protein
VSTSAHCACAASSAQGAVVPSPGEGQPATIAHARITGFPAQPGKSTHQSISEISLALRRYRATL